MKNIIPFKKDIIFKTKIGEITSISLENTLKMVDDVIEGNFIINGDYKTDLDSSSTEPFNLEIPFKNVIDERYDTDRATIDIDDFYYEITNDNVLSISIDVLVDKLEEKLMEESIKIEEEKVGEDKIEKDEERNIDVKEKITTLFNTDDNDTYVTYNVCIVRENDTVDSILEKYGITHDQLEKYNDLTDIKIGDKLLIPSEDE